MMKSLVLLACALLYACATTPETATPETASIDIDGLIVNNVGREDIANIRLTVQATNRFVACANIVVGGICSTIFPARKYSGGKLTIAWSVGAREFVVRDQVITSRLLSVPGKNLLISVNVSGDGSLSISLINQ